MFSRKCVCKLNIPKIVRPLLAALSVNGLTIFFAVLPISPGPNFVQSSFRNFANKQGKAFIV